MIRSRTLAVAASVAALSFAAVPVAAADHTAAYTCDNNYDPCRQPVY
jgi:hypothetical protein